LPFHVYFRGRVGPEDKHLEDEQYDDSIIHDDEEGEDASGSLDDSG
jgi:hypothetical protein